MRVWALTLGLGLGVLHWGAGCREQPGVQVAGLRVWALGVRICW